MRATSDDDDAGCGGPPLARSRQTSAHPAPNAATAASITEAISSLSASPHGAHPKTQHKPSRTSRSVSHFHAPNAYQTHDVIAPNAGAPSHTPETERAFLNLTINGIDAGQVLAVVKPSGDVLVPLAPLAGAGLHVSVPTTNVDGTPYVSLRALAPQTAFSFDQRALSLDVTAQTSQLTAQTLNLEYGAPPDITHSTAPSAFFNYALNWVNYKQLSEFSELGVSSRGNLYYSGFSFQPNGSFVRGLTNATFDNPAHMKRWIVGDSFASGGLLGGNTFIGGVTVQRDFGLNPYFIQYPGVAISGQALTPSTAQVYVNGHLVSTQPVAPGRFDITNIPVVAGGGNAQVVVRDAFGRTQTLTSNYYYATSVLGRGISDYSYSLGSQRSDVGTASFDYGPAVFVGQERVGITNWFTGGGRLDAASGLVSGGPTAAFRLGHGQLGMQAAMSADKGGGGGAGELDYSYENRFVTYGGSLVAVSPHYATASLPSTANRTTSLATVFTGFQVGVNASVQLSYTASQMRDTGRENIAALTGSVHLTRKLDLLVNADDTFTGVTGSTRQYFLGVTYQLGPETLATISGQGGTGGAGTGVALNRSLPLGTGYGYLLSHGTGSEITDEDYVQAQTSFGFYQASYLGEHGSSQSDLLASGGLVDAGDGVMITRPVDDGFAVIEVPGLRGVRGYYNNQIVGKTDGRGRLLVPNVLSYYGNKVEISDQDVPIDYSIESTEETVSPPYRGGVLARFPVQRVAAVTGEVVVGDHPSSVIPSFAQLRVAVNGKRQVSELNADGRFYIEDVSPGRYTAQVDYPDGSCEFSLVVPKLHGAVTELGRVPCLPRQVGAATP